MERWTRAVIRFRWPVVAIWAVVVAAGFVGSSRLADLQSNVFSVPGSDSERVRSVLEQRFGDRSDGNFTVVFALDRPLADGDLARYQGVMARAAGRLPTGRAQALREATPRILYGDIVSTLNLSDAKARTNDLVAAVRATEGARVYVTGAAAIQHDLDPIFNDDLKKGESIAIPIALVVLLAVFGLSLAVSIPLLFAASTIFGTLGLVFLAAHWLVMPTYVTNLVYLIGLGIAVDYSLLVVYRFREELAGGASVDEAVLRTMRTAGRAVVFSGVTVAIGLALLLFMPLPFMRAMGVGGFLIPLVSIAAALTLQPALLRIYGRRGMARAPVAGFLRSALGIPLPRLGAGGEHGDGLWARLARSIMRRPIGYLAAAAALLIAAAIPALGLQLTPGSTHGIPRYPQAVKGFDLLRDAVGPGLVSPSQVLVDGGRDGSVLTGETQAAIDRLLRRIRTDSEVATAFYEPGARFVDARERYAQIIVAGRHDYGDEASQRFVHRLRSDLIPAAGFPDGVRVLAGGAPPQGVDFLEQAYGAFPYLVLGVLALTYLLLLRAFRSLVLPLKAVVLNLLSVAASYGALVLVFRYGVGSELFGLYQFDQVEGWIPIFLFAMLFGLSMDYEVFLVTRMREAWDEGADNARAVAIGLERTGRIITAAAVIMVAAFSGFLAGSIVGLQQFGFGLAVAILVDATVIRALLVPALMAVMGRYNWWLPVSVARWVRVKPSPVSQRPAPRPTGR